jgi:hypothetical protein
VDGDGLGELPERLGQQTGLEGRGEAGRGGLDPRILPSRADESKAP